MDAERLQPALLGGVFIGVLSALPIISAGNCCCCLWVIAGGVLAVYLRQQNAPIQVDAAEGAFLGLIAGVVGGILASVLGFAVSAMFGAWQPDFLAGILESNPDMPPEAREMLERLSAGTAVAGLAVASIVLNVVISAVFGLIGGLLGVAIFKKNAPPPPPQPPTVITHDPGVAH